MDDGGTPSYDFSLLVKFLVCAIFSFSFCHALEACGIPSLGIHLFSSSFFLTHLVGIWHTFFGYASFISFCIAHIIAGNFREGVMA